MATLAALAIGITQCSSQHRERYDRAFFWVIGLALVVFAVLRPIGLARDDMAYTQILEALCPLGDCSKGTPITRDYAWFYLMKLALPFRPGSLRVALLLSGLGVLVKIVVIDRLCRQRLLALLLFIPLCYLQYDLTQLRAGLAISWMMVGIYFLVRSHWIFGAVALGSNFAVHSQAVFSPGLLTYRVFRLSRWVLPVSVSVLLLLLYSGLHPSLITLSWLGVLPETAPYYSEAVSGAHDLVKPFPWAFLLILIYGTWLCNSKTEHHKLTEVVSAGLVLGVGLAWFFAIIPAMQGRFFEFYAIPVALIAGNIGQSRLKLFATVLLGMVLYFRLDILHDWILG